MMDNGQMARWVARVEHVERMEAEKRDEAFWRDIRADDAADATVSQTAESRHIQPAGGELSLWGRLASIRDRLGNKRKSELTCTEA